MRIIQVFRFNNNNIRNISEQNEADEADEHRDDFHIEFCLSYNVLVQHMSAIAKFLGSKKFLFYVNIMIIDVPSTIVVDLNPILCCGKIYNRKLEIGTFSSDPPLRIDASNVAKISQYKYVTLLNTNIDGKVYGCAPQINEKMKKRKWKIISFVENRCMHSIVDSLNTITMLSDSPWRAEYQIDAGIEIRSAPRELEMRSYNVRQLEIRTALWKHHDVEIWKVVEGFSLLCPLIRECTFEIQSTELLCFSGRINSSLRKMTLLEELSIYVNDTKPEAIVSKSALDNIFRLPVKSIQFKFHINYNTIFYKTFFECVALKKATFPETRISVDYTYNKGLQFLYSLYMNISAMSKRKFKKTHGHLLQEIWTKYCSLASAVGKVISKKIMSMTCVVPEVIIEYFIKLQNEILAAAENTQAPPLRKKMKITVD